MKIDDIIGDIVYIAFRDPERLVSIGITEKSGNYLVNGFDQFGIWLSHPGLFLVTDTDESGKPIPPAKQHRERIEANFLATWDNIITMMHYPDREGYDFPNEFNKNFGFIIKGSRKRK